MACEGAIPDLTPPDNLTSTLNVPAGTCGNSPNLGHVDVRLEILHDWRGDLTVRLDRPGGAGAEVRLASDDPNDDISQTIAVPDGAFDGLPRQGVFRLQVTDTSRSGIGALLGWSVILPCPEVSVVATDGSAGPSDTDTGTFTIKRTGATDVPLEVVFSVAGTAGAGDIVALQATVTVPVGAASVDVSVVPIDDDLTGEAAETVIVTVEEGGYTVAAAAPSATVTLVADGALPPDAGVPDAPLPDAALPDAPPPDAAPPAPPDAAVAVADAPVASVADAAVTEESGEGGGCRLAARGSAGGWLAGLALLLVLTLRRRRRPGA